MEVKNGDGLKKLELMKEVTSETYIERKNIFNFSNC